MTNKSNSMNAPIKPIVQPWYRIGMVWLMIGLPLIVVVASMVTVVIAHQNAPRVIDRHVSHSAP